MKNAILYEDESLGFKIRKRGERNLEVCYYYRPNVWVSTGTRDKKEAIDNIKAKLAGMMRPIKKKSDITLNEYAKNFFLRTDPNSLKARNENFKKFFAEDYYQSRQGRLDNYILPRFGQYRISCISDMEVENWYSGLHLMSGKSASDNTKLKILDTFSIVMECARKEGYIKNNPIKDVEKINSEPEHVRIPFTAEEIRILSPNDRAEVLRIWGTLQWAVYFSIMIDTGWRAGEVSALSRADIRPNGIYSKKSVSGRTRSVKDSIKTSKKGQDYKIGILSDYTWNLLNDYLEEMPPLEMYLFKVGWKKRFTIPEVSNKHLKASLERAGIPVKGRTQHCFRHSFDTDMLNSLSNDIEIKDVYELMAHTGYQATYDHRTPDDMLNRLVKVKSVLNHRRVV